MESYFKNINSNFQKFMINEFISSFILALENEIIPKVIEQIKLPGTSSIFKIMEHEFRSQRSPKILRDISDKKDPYRKSALIQKFALLREKFNGHQVNETSVNLYKPTANHNPELLERIKPDFETYNSLKESINQQIDISDLFEFIPIDKNLNSSNKAELEEIIEIKEFFQFDDKIKEKILDDSVFMKFINQVEISLIRFMKKNLYNFNCKLFFEHDFEIPNLKKIILSFNTNSMNIQEKLNFWDEVDDFLRYNIEELAKFIPIEQRIKFLDYDNNFFTNVLLD